MKKNIKDIKELEFKCDNCGTRVIFDFENRKRTITRCLNCDFAFFRGDSDVLSALDDVFFRLKDTKGLQVSFICDDEKGKNDK